MRQSSGHPVTVLAEELDRGSLLVLGSRHRSAVGGSFSGAVSAGVAARSDCPVAHDRRGLSDILGVLLDLSIERRVSPPPELASWLQGFTGTSQATRTAKRLLAL